jgi:hypothetical protein
MRRFVVEASQRLGWLAQLTPLLVLAACQVQNDFVVERVAGSAGLSGTSGAASNGGSTGTGGAGSVSDCPPDRASISLPLADRTRQRRCSALVARRSFSHAVCSCNDVDVEGVLATDAVDSSQPDAGSGRGGAAVGVNGLFRGGDYVRIDGSLTIASAAPFNSPGGLDIAGDLRLAGATTTAGPILVSRDAWLLADTSSFSIANVGRDLHLAPGAALTALGRVTVGGGTLQDALDHAPPCACATGELLDIAGIVSNGMTDNDNAAIGLGLDALRDVASRTELTLHCGRFALRGISGSAAISLHVTGRVALVVEGDAQIPPDFSLDLAPGAELDWFISGDLALRSDTRIGASQFASAVRVYTLGANEITLPGTDQVAMNLYAPRANVTVETLGNIYGAVFASKLSARGPLFAHYDRAVLRTAEACTLPPPLTCTSCDQCSGTRTCSAGTCAACVSDADCCFPLTCEQGECQALIAN